MAIAQISNATAADLANSCPFAHNPASNLLQWRAQPCLLKMRQTVGVKRLLARQFTRDHRGELGHRDRSWRAVEDTFKLSGWDNSRRAMGRRWAAKPIWH